MKKNYTFLIILALLLAFTNCKKEESLKNNVTGAAQSFSDNITSELQNIYNQLPNTSYGIIKLVHGDILQFQSKEHYAQVYETLLDRYDTWSMLFFESYSKCTNEELECKVASTNFDERMPLFEFEKQCGIENHNLRALRDKEEEMWKNLGQPGDPPPFDSLIICPVEQTLFSEFYEVCIGDTICQIRSNGYQILIPLSSQQYIGQVRSATTPQVISHAGDWGVIVLSPKSGTCYEKKWKIEQPIDRYNGYKFIWSYHFWNNWFSGTRATVVMKNFKWKNNEWKKDYAVCALGSSSEIYIDISTAWGSCLGGGFYGKNPKNPNKAYTRTVVTQIVFMDTDPKLFRVNPANSEVKCRSYGEDYVFNVETGQRKN